MDVKNYEELYHKIEEESCQALNRTDINTAVLHAIYENFDNMDIEYMFGFAKYMEFHHGASIKAAFEKGLGNIAKVDYEILTQITEIVDREKKNFAAFEPKQELSKREEKYNKRLNKAKKHAEELLDELSK